MPRAFRFWSVALVQGKCRRPRSIVRDYESLSRQVCDEGLFFAAERAFLPAIFFRLDGLKGAVTLVFRAAFFFLALPLLRDFFAPPDFFFAMLESLSRIQTS